LKLSESLTELVARKGANEILNRSWILRLYSGRPQTNNLLGISQVFKSPAKPHFQILQTGTLDHGVMTCVAASMVEQLKRITKQLKKMQRLGKSADEMAALASGWDLDSKEEIPEDFITFTCGNYGEDLNVRNLYLMAGDTLIIDHLEIG
jgi:hypothetical protein